MAGLFSVFGATGVGKWLFSQLKNLNIGSLLPWFGSLGAGSAAHARNTQLMKQQNAFNAGEAALNRDFQHNEAEIARQWQEDFYNQYQSPQAMVHQYEAAGLNPVLSTGMPTNTPPTASSAQGSMAQGASAPYLDSTGIMQQFMGLMKLDAEIANIKADTRQKDASADKFLSDITLNDQNIKESTVRISKLSEETKSEQLRQGLIVADEMLKRGQLSSVNYDNAKKQFEQSFKEKYGFYPDSSIVKTSLGILNETVRNIEYGIDKTINFVKEKYNQWF